MHILAAPKSRGICSLLLLLMVAVLPDARSASPALHKGLAPHSREREATPGHTSRILSRGEIFRAIRDDLARKGIRESGDLRPEDLKIQFAAPVSGEDAGLQVKEIGFDPIRRETIFELWTSREPQLLPFQVATRWDRQRVGSVPRHDKKAEDVMGSANLPARQYSGSAGWTPTQVTSAVMPGSRARGSAQTGRGLVPARFRPPVLARPGWPATLVVLGRNFRITTTVIPLQPGSKGQCILVRNTATERVIPAEVVAEGLLRTSF
jgi:hypothetical protein